MYEWEEYLSDIYYDSSKPESFSGPDKLYEYIQRDGKYDISKHKIRKWLQRQEHFQGIKYLLLVLIISGPQISWI